MDVVERFRSLERQQKWHPKPPPLPKCKVCGKEFRDTLFRVPVKDADGKPTGDERRVVLKAKAMIQLHVWASEKCNPSSSDAT